MNRNYGWKKQKQDDRDHPFNRTLSVSKLPSNVDLRDKMPPVYDQGQLGSCTANAIGAAVHYDQLSKGIDFMPSRLFIYYNERSIEGTISQDAGANIRDGVKSINSQGVCVEDEWIYDISKFAQKPDKKCYDDAILHESIKYESVLQDKTQIKSALANGFPVIFGFQVKESFESQNVAMTGLYKPKAKEQIIGGHAVLIVGYIGTSFIVRNSWGENWGQKGYFSMPMTEVLNPKISNDFWVIETVK